MTYETPSQHELRTMPEAFGVEEKPYFRSNFKSDLWKKWREENEKAIELRNQLNQKYVRTNPS